MTFPFANRRGTTILDRSTAYPLFGLRAGRLAAVSSAAGDIDIVHGLGASALGYALADLESGTRAPLVFNPQGLEEFGATDPSRARLKRLGYWPLRVAVRRSARAADRVIATDRSLVGPGVHAPGRPQGCRSRHSQRDRAGRLRSTAAAGATPSLARRAWSAARRRAASQRRPAGSEQRVSTCWFALWRHLAQQNALPARWRWVLVGDGPGVPLWSARSQQPGSDVDASRARPGERRRTCTPGTKPRRCSSIPRSTRAAPSSRSRRWRTARPVVAPAARVVCRTKSFPA